MLKPFFSRGVLELRHRPYQAKVIPTAVRIPKLQHKKQKATYEVKLSNKTERVFHKWDQLVTFMRFPPERGPELFTTCFTNRGEWVEFSDDTEEGDDEALNTPILYVCSTCSTMETISPLQSVMTNCKCGGTWNLVDIEEFKAEPLPSERFEKVHYDF